MPDRSVFGNGSNISHANPPCIVATTGGSAECYPQIPISSTRLAGKLVESGAQSTPRRSQRNIEIRSEPIRHGDEQPHNHDHDDHRSNPSNDEQPEIIAIFIIVAHPDTPAAAISAARLSCHPDRARRVSPARRRAVQRAEPKQNQRDPYQSNEEAKKPPCGAMLAPYPPARGLDDPARPDPLLRRPDPRHPRARPHDRDGRRLLELEPPELLRH